MTSLFSFDFTQGSDGLCYIVRTSQNGDEFPIGVTQSLAEAEEWVRELRNEEDERRRDEGLGA